MKMLLLWMFKQLLPQAIGVILTSRTTHIGRCVHLSIAYMKYLRFYPSLVKQCYCTTQRPPFVSILSCSHVLGTTTIHGALLSCGSFFALHIFLRCTFLALHIFGVAHFFASHIFCVAHFFPLHNFCVAQFLRSTFFAFHIFCQYVPLLLGQRYFE